MRDLVGSFFRIDFWKTFLLNLDGLSKQLDWQLRFSFRPSSTDENQEEDFDLVYLKRLQELLSSMQKIANERKNFAISNYCKGTN